MFLDSGGESAQKEMSDCCTSIFRWYANRFRGLSTKEHIVFWVVVAVLLALNFTFLSLELQALNNSLANPVSTVQSTYRSADRLQLMPREFMVTAQFVAGGRARDGCTQWVNLTCYHGCTHPMPTTDPTTSSTEPEAAEAVSRYEVDPTGQQVFLMFGATLGSRVQFAATANGTCIVPGVSLSIYPKASEMGAADPSASSIQVLPTAGQLSALSLSVSITTNVHGNKTYSILPTLTGALRVTDVDWTTNNTDIGPANYSVPTPDSTLIAISFPVVGCPLNPKIPCYPVTEQTFSYSMSWRDVAASVFALVNISITALVFLFPYRAVATHRVISLFTDPQTPPPPTIGDSSSAGADEFSTPHADVSATASLRLNSYQPPTAAAGSSSDSAAF